MFLKVHKTFKGQIPALWKQANVTPIHKKNDPSDITNYRPTSLLSTVGKVLEKLFTNLSLIFLWALKSYQLFSQALLLEMVLFQSI